MDFKKVKNIYLQVALTNLSYISPEESNFCFTQEGKNPDRFEGQELAVYKGRRIFRVNSLDWSVSAILLQGGERGNSPLKEISGNKRAQLIVFSISRKRVYGKILHKRGNLWYFGDTESMGKLFPLRVIFFC